MSRDSQRQKLYNAENKARRLLEEGGHQFRDVKTEARYKARLKAIMDSKWMTDTYPEATRRPVHLNWSSTKRHGACAGADGITTSLSDWVLHEMVLVHELAHTIEKRLTGVYDPGHGRAYAAIYLKLVRRFIGAQAYATLRTCFREGGVKYVPKRKRTVPVGVKAELPPALAAMNERRVFEAAVRFAAQVKAERSQGVEITKRSWVVGCAKRAATGEIVFWSRCGHTERFSDATPDQQLYASWQHFKRLWVA